MDKKGVEMMYKKYVMLCALFLSLLSLTGCQTAKGAAVGVGSTVEGAAKDTQNLGAAIMAADDWIRKNLW